MSYRQISSEGNINHLSKLFIPCLLSVRHRAPVPGTGYHGQSLAAPSTVGTPGSYGYYHGTSHVGQPPHSQIPLQDLTEQAQGRSQPSESQPSPSYDIPSNQRDVASPPPPYEQQATTPQTGDVSTRYNEKAAFAAPNVVEPGMKRYQ